MDVNIKHLNPNGGNRYVFKYTFRRVPSGEQECFAAGTDWSLTSADKCVCLEDYYGKDCGIPDSVWFGHFKDRPRERKALVRRPKLRRLVQGVLVNHEFDFFETR